KCGNVDAGRQDFLLQGSNVLPIDQRVVDLWNWVFPEQHFLWNLGAEPARARAQITVQELEPGTNESVGKLIGVIEEVTRDFLVNWVEGQGKVGRQHCWLVLLVGVVGIRNEGIGIVRNPLGGTTRALDELKLILEEVLEEVVAPLDRGLCPDD